MKGAIQGGFPWQVGSDVCRIAVGFTTNGSGVTTTKYDYKGKVTIAKSTNTYVVTLPAPWVTTVALKYSQNQLTPVTCAVTNSPSAGTVTFAFSGAFNSGDVNFDLEFLMDS